MQLLLLLLFTLNNIMSPSNMKFFIINYKLYYDKKQMKNAKYKILFQIYSNINRHLNFEKIKKSSTN